MRPTYNNANTFVVVGRANSLEAACTAWLADTAGHAGRFQYQHPDELPYIAGAAVQVGVLLQAVAVVPAAVAVRSCALPPCAFRALLSILP